MKGTKLMKSLAELAAIREQMKDKVAIRTGSGEIRVVVGMATCGISAGARPVLSTFVEEVANAGLADKVMVTQTGCIGICQLQRNVRLVGRELPGPGVIGDGTLIPAMGYHAFGAAYQQVGGELTVM